MIPISRFLFLLAVLFLGASCDSGNEPFLKIEREQRVVNYPRSVDGDMVGVRPIGEDLYEAQYIVSPVVFESSRAQAVDPFAEPAASSDDVNKHAQEKLERAGISFGEGASAKYHPESGILVVVQTREQIELVEAYIGGGCNLLEKQIQIRMEIYRLPSLAGLEALESVRAQSDHTPERDAVLLAVHGRKARLLAAPMILCRSGQRAKVTESISEKVEMSDSESEDSEERKTAAADENLLLELEADPILGADEFTIDVNSALVFRSDDRLDVRRSLTAQTTLLHGTWQLIGNWNIGGDEMILVFLTANVQRTGDYGALIDLDSERH